MTKPASQPASGAGQSVSQSAVDSATGLTSVLCGQLNALIRRASHDVRAPTGPRPPQPPGRRSGDGRRGSPGGQAPSSHGWPVGAPPRPAPPVHRSDLVNPFNSAAKACGGAPANSGLGLNVTVLRASAGLQRMRCGAVRCRNAPQRVPC